MIYLIGEGDGRVMAVAENAQDVEALAKDVYEIGGIQYIGATMLESVLFAGVNDIYENGEFLPPLPPAKSPEEIRREIMDGVQRYLDDFATTKTYDSMLSACTYATSTVPQFAKEGQYCVEKRDECWATVARVEAEVLAGTRPAPTGFDDIRGELPVLEWPA